jgi:uncharacterized repeat protein (TIGR04076 family)
MYKVVCEAYKISEPKSIDGNELHVKWPCRIYKVGDKMTFSIHPGSIMVLEETDKVCISALGAILPIVRGMMQGKAEDWDFIDDVKFFSCPDAERPVIFEVKRIRMEPPVHGVTTYEDEQKEV